MTLDQVKNGHQCSVLSFAKSAAAALPRFYSIGLFPLSQVQIIRRAPLGDPIIVKISNTLWSLRASEARLIEVETNDLTAGKVEVNHG